MRCCVTVKLILFIYINILSLNNSMGNIEIKNKFRFPFGDPLVPYIGLFVGLSLPIDLANIDLYFTANMEAVYYLPTNETEFSYPPDISSRSIFPITRWNFYKAVEAKLRRLGYQGEDCLLRTICEASEMHLSSNGVLGDLLNVVLRPSLSLIEEKMTTYLKAENYGEIKRHCKKYSKSCPISILGQISWIEDI